MNPIKLQRYAFPLDLEGEIGRFVDCWNHQSCHDSLDNVTSADVYFGRVKEVLARREEIKRQTPEARRHQHTRRWGWPPDRRSRASVSQLGAPIRLIVADTIQPLVLSHKLAASAGLWLASSSGRWSSSRRPRLCLRCAHCPTIEFSRSRNASEAGRLQRVVGQQRMVEMRRALEHRGCSAPRNQQTLQLE
jgi:hypothetical protein